MVYVYSVTATQATDGGSMTNTDYPIVDPAKLGPMITTKTASALLAMTDRKIRDMCVKGEVKAVKVGSDWRINTAAFLSQFGID